LLKKETQNHYYSNCINPKNSQLEDSITDPIFSSVKNKTSKKTPKLTTTTSINLGQRRESNMKINRAKEEIETKK